MAAIILTELKLISLLLFYGNIYKATKTDKTYKNSLQLQGDGLLLHSVRWKSRPNTPGVIVCLVMRIDFQEVKGLFTTIHIFVQ